MRAIAVCPTVGRADLVRTLVLSWRRAWGKMEPPRLIVLAMPPAEGVVEWCRDHDVDVIAIDKVLPFAAAVNYGASQALALEPKADWLFLVNNDIEMHAASEQTKDGPIVANAATAMREAIAWGWDMIGARLLYPDGRIQHTGKWFSLDFYPFHCLRGEPAEHKMAAEPHVYPGVTFALVGIKAGLWSNLGGLDEQFHNGYEDDDLCLRARAVGATIGVHPAFSAIHLESQTTGNDAANKAAMWQLFKAKWIDSGLVQTALGVWQGWRFSG